MKEGVIWTIAPESVGLVWRICETGSCDLLVRTDKMFKNRIMLMGSAMLRLCEMKACWLGVLGVELVPLAHNRRKTG